MISHIRSKSPEVRWRWLYRTAGAAALLSLILIPVAGLVFFLGGQVPGFQPTAANVRNWFQLIRDNTLVGLFDLDLVMVADNVLAAPLFLALYLALRRESESMTIIGVALAFVGLATYFAINPAFSMLSLSQQYALAASDTERSGLVAAGQTIMAVYDGTGFKAYLVLASIAGLLFSAAMLRGHTFWKGTAYAGILANALNLGMFLPVVGFLIGFLALLPLIAWYALVANTFFRLAGRERENPAKEHLGRRNHLVPLPTSRA